MSEQKRPTAKHKVDRRFGCNLWGRGKSPYNIRQSRPGMHGQARGKQTNYGIQLMAKQKLKAYYGNIGEKAFRKYYQEASRLRGDTSQNLIGLLESRLDAVIYRSKFAPTVFAARQLVSHKHVTVNGKKVNIPSYIVKEGDVIEVRTSARTIPAVMQAIESAERDLPEYIDIDAKGFKATFLRTPRLEDVPYPVQMEPHLVVEFYSR
ncbi:MAG: 30S ribosomal protein S4 [Rhodospirillales bacterium]|nr:30S ribosomal protein S4 [Rhodospirillales bacterium]MCB9964575.1 30S ribosomal protein S4 [Rhodospirillales bacterium]MCB9973902.1 30S ribosomal protein S4 [Rhodospirillales bacterium]MCB9980527.1 30S ribosomal protein S4 [Rhodospirillales bacterium]